MNQSEIRDSLDRCLLAEDELHMDWQEMDDPFPNVAEGQEELVQ